MARALIQVHHVEGRIRMVRGRKVLLDEDLARFYGVSTKRLNQQVRRNRRRFPQDFVFQLTVEELEGLRLEDGTSSSKGRGGRRYAPLAFTEHGAIMAACILNTPRAIEVSVFVVRAFVRARGFKLTKNAWLSKLSELGSRIDRHDQAIQYLFTGFQELTESLPEPKRGKFGFASHNDK